MKSCSTTNAVFFACRMYLQAQNGGCRNREGRKSSRRLFLGRRTSWWRGQPSISARSPGTPKARQSGKHRPVSPNTEWEQLSAAHLQTGSEPKGGGRCVSFHSLAPPAVTISYFLVNDALDLHGLHDVRDELWVDVGVSDLFVEQSSDGTLNTYRR